MKKLQLLHIRESLASRISLWIVLCAVLILTATGLIANYYVVKSIKLEESVKANGILYIMRQRIDAALISVEVAVRNHIKDIKDNQNEPDELYRMTRRMLEDNPSIVGSAIAFRPNYFPEKGKWFSPYSYREDGGISTKQLGTINYDYFKMEWYQTTDSLKRDHWSDPYFDEGGGEMLMTTYSYPLTDETGNLIAVVTADILLEDLSKLLDVNYFEYAYACMISRTGSIISHPNKELVLQQNIFSIAEKTGHPELIEVGHEMIEGKSGMREWQSPSFGKSYIFFVPFEHTGWSMAIICKASELFKEVRKTALFLAVLFIVMLALLTNILRRGVHRLIAPLTTFTQAVDEVAQGNLQAKLPVIHSKDEMQRLHHSFSTMQRSLVSQMEELKIVNEAKGRIEGELKVARDIQLSMLPKAYIPTDNNNNLDIYGQLISAKEVGGDLYDFFIRDDKLFFCIGDVSGKGVPAALVMAMTLSQFRNVVSYEDDLVNIIKSINKTTCDGNDTFMFVTFFVGVLDLPTGRLHYCNAGHNKPFIVSSDITELPAKPDLPLGVEVEASYVVREYNVPAGAMLFLYTDGLTEAMNSQREQFGRERLKEVLKGGNGCKGMIAEMTQAVKLFVGKASQSDDLTILAIRYLSTHVK
ncbi:MAG: SpoIIE family protein phosphatase [Bacteroidaceae bacterium]|nr:SpoIIE family protein phosphatase [Bacteroidaceae bacterium]